MRALLAALLVVSISAPLHASDPFPVEIGARARGAETVVVGTIIDVQAAFGRNVHGDELILSRAAVLVEETLKGQPTSATVAVVVEGGTVGDLTLRVSDMPPVQAGERAVFFLRRTSAGELVPHLRGQGILKLDASGRVRGSGLTVEQVRQLVRGASNR